MLGFQFLDPSLQNFVMGERGLLAQGYTDILRNYPLYSVVSILDAAALGASYTFFGDAEGQNSKTRWDTNMLTGGQMSPKEAFLITSINLNIQLASTASDLFEDADSYLNVSGIELIKRFTQIVFSCNGNNEILTVKTVALPGGNDLVVQGVTGIATAGAYNASATNGVQDAGNAFPFVYPLAPGQNFKVVLECTTTAPTLPTMTTGTGWRVELRLNGWRFRKGTR